VSLSPPAASSPVSRRSAPVFGADDSFPLVVALALPARFASPAVLAERENERLRTTAAMAVDLGAVDRPAKARTASLGR
jgi:hypothetical protein